MEPKAVRGSRTPLLRFLAFMRPHRRLVAGAALMGIGKFALPLAFPLAFKYVIDVLLAARPNLEGTNRLIDSWCSTLSHFIGLGGTPAAKLEVLSLAILALYGIQGITSYYRNYWAGIAGNRLISELQCAMYSHLHRLGQSFFDRNPVGGIVSRVLQDVSQANELVNSVFIDVWMDAVSLALVIAALFYMNWRLALVAICIAPVWWTFMRTFSPRIKAISHRIQERVEEISSELHERIAGASTIKSFCREDYEVDRFRQQRSNLYDRMIDKVRLAATQEMLIQLLTRSAPMVVIWVGALMILHGTMTLGTLVAFVSYLGFLYLPLERFAQLSVVVASSLAAIERIFSFLDIKPDVVDHPLSRPFPMKRGTIRFERVSFNYVGHDHQGAREVLKGVNLEIPGGARVALVGRSGAGKTTISKLIPRFYDVTQGRVLIDGRDVKHWTLKSLRESVSMVAQDALLFGVSVRDNLRYARPDASDDELWEALESANLRHFVEQLPQGLDTIIGEQGVQLSGGQRQRVALARAFLKDAKIVILDEATSAVDSEAENLIHEAMDHMLDGRTTILIAHRLRSAINADLIVVLDNGRVVETGSHEELLRRGGTYARLFREQARGLALDPMFNGWSEQAEMAE